MVQLKMSVPKYYNMKEYSRHLHHVPRSILNL